MLFDLDFLDSAEEDPVTAAVDACSLIMAELDKFPPNDSWSEAEHEILWEGASFIDLLIESKSINVDAELPDATGSIGDNCKALTDYIQFISSQLREESIKLKVDGYKNRYSHAFSETFAYEFSQGDLDRIQVILNELRTSISDTRDLEDDHKRRLIKRLERLQLELHKRVSDLDRFWGLVGDAGVVLGKLGNDAKPIVDRIREVAEIVWKTQARTEELPSDSSNPMIEHVSDT